MGTNFAELDPVIHSRVRLAVMILLLHAESADFTYLKKELEVSDGNLSTHLRKLEKVKYIKMQKRFENRKPKTTISLTEKGRNALDEYTTILDAYLLLASKAK
ncbi:MAG: transcriptional regulator [Candidatus Cloacimonetes bacterium]|jgi:DNA-binding MarR family transcriptional regulator|nr:transcriptional regulator [Candidatus Cloacimonadota bacterium]